MKIVLKYIPVFLFLFFTEKTACAQNKGKSVTKIKKQADIALEKLDYLKAFNLYTSIITKDTSDVDAYYKAGICLFSINKTDSTAAYYFTRALSIPESHFYLGRIYHLKEANNNALEKFLYFKSINDGSGIDNFTVDMWIKKCENAIKFKHNEQDVVIENVGKVINSEYSEYVPLIMHNGQYMVFTSRRPNESGPKDVYGNYYEDIYISKKENNTWAAPNNAGSVLNTATHDACVTVSPSDELIIYRSSEQSTTGDLYKTQLFESGCSIPEKLPYGINSEYQEASLCYSSFTNEIYFSSNRPGGYGGKDLYKIRVFMDGSASKPKNLGPEINTSEDEDAPFIDNDKHVLYFSSKGHNSIGEYDIYRADYDINTEEWLTPENMGSPVNSSGDDIYYFENEDHSHAYFSSNRIGGFGAMDIYEISFTESKYTIVKGTLKFSQSEIGDIKLTVYDNESGNLVGIYNTINSSKTFILYLEKNKTYKIVAEGSLIKTNIIHFTLNENQNELLIDLGEK